MCSIFPLKFSDNSFKTAENVRLSVEGIETIYSYVIIKLVNEKSAHFPPDECAVPGD